MVVVVLFIAGDHVPVKLFIERSGKAACGASAQMGATCVNVGSIPTQVAKLSVVLFVPHEFCVVTVYAVVGEALLGVPDIVPVTVLKVKPAGNGNEVNVTSVGTKATPFKVSLANIVGNVAHVVPFTTDGVSFTASIVVTTTFAVAVSQLVGTAISQIV